MLSTTMQTPMHAALAAVRFRAVPPFAGAVVTRSQRAPIGAVQGTAVSAAGRSALGAAAATGSPPREAPV